MSLTGADRAIIRSVRTSASAIADITAKHITGNFTADNKVYDGGVSASVLTRTLNNTIMGDDVEIWTAGTATFAIKMLLTE